MIFESLKIDTNHNDGRRNKCRNIMKVMCKGETIWGNFGIKSTPRSQFVASRAAAGQRHVTAVAALGSPALFLDDAPGRIKRNKIERSVSKLKKQNKKKNGRNLTPGPAAKKFPARVSNGRTGSDDDGGVRWRDWPLLSRRGGVCYVRNRNRDTGTNRRPISSGCWRPA